MRPITTIMMLGLVALSSHAYAGITKWVDSEGKVHYSDQPPPTNVKSTNLSIEDPTPAAPDAREKLQKYQNVIEEGRKKRLAEQLEAEKIAADKRAAADKAKLAADEAAKKAGDAAAQSNLNSGGTAQSDSSGYTGYGGYSGYTPLGAPAPNPAPSQ